MTDKGTAGGGSSVLDTLRRMWRRRVPRRSLALALCGALALLACAAATVAARPARARSPEQTAALLQKRAAAQQTRAAARRARREGARPARGRGAARTRPRREGHEGRARRPGRQGHGPERENAVVTSTCTRIDWTFRKFPALPGNTVIEKIEIGHMAPVFKTQRFDGDAGLQLTPINAPPGRGRIDTGAKWKGNGVQGGFDIHSRKHCPPAPAFTIEKLQKIEASFTKSPLKGLMGETVFYEMIVRNTGNMPLVLSNFSDPRCDSGTIAGGPGQTPLQPGPTPEMGEATTFTCRHVLTSTELYENDASVTATPPGEAPITHSSNTVVVNAPPPEPAFTIEKLQKIEGVYATSPLTGKAGQTVDYEIIVTDTGNTSLTFSGFTDEHCDAGTITGGPSGPLLAHESATYLCSHLLTSGDQAAGSYSNSATDTATATEGSPITHSSNTVVVTLASEHTSPVIYVGYADGAANDHGAPSGFPSPWKGSAGVTFIGCGSGGADSCPTSGSSDVYDAGAIRIEATTGSGAIALTGAAVTIGPCAYEPWPGINATAQPGQSLILTQTGKHRCAPGSAAEQDNFDTSESFLLSPQYQQFLKTGKCTNDGYVPAITLTLNGKTVTVSDTGQTLNDGGIDPDICLKVSEARNWVKLSSTGASRLARTPVCSRAGRHRRRAAGCRRPPGSAGRVSEHRARPMTRALSVVEVAP